MFIDLDTSAGVSVLKTYLQNFTWAGRDPDDTFAMMFGLNLSASF
jgi:hypothetical protein